MKDDITIKLDLPCDDATAPRDLTSLARRAFDAFYGPIGDNTPTPTWDGITPEARFRWRAAVLETAYQVTAGCKRQIGTAVAGELRFTIIPESK